MKNYIRAACADFTLKLLLLKLNASGVVCVGAKAYNPRTGEAEAGRSLSWKPAEVTLRHLLSTITKLKMRVSGTLWVF